MLHQIGLLLLIWLAAGFLTGVKAVLVDQNLTKEKVDQMYEESDEYGKHLTDKFARKKSTFIALCTLMGFISAYYYLVGRVNKMRKKAGKSHKMYIKYTVKFILVDFESGTTYDKIVESVETDNAAAIRDALDSLTNVERAAVFGVSLAINTKE